MGDHIKKSISSICALITFLFVLNLLLGIIISTTGVFQSSITNNNSMKFMEICNEGDLKRTSEIYQYLKSLEDVNSCFIDVSFPVVVVCDNESNNETYNLLGVPKEMLVNLGIESPKDEKYLFLPKRHEEYFKDSLFIFEVSEYVVNEDGAKVVNCHDMTFDITGYYEDISLDLFPEDLAIIDEETAMTIAKNASESGEEIYSSRVIATVDDVSSMNAVEEKLVRKFENVTVRYDLKYTHELPSYAKILITISGVILSVIFIICICNIQSGITQMMSLRKRDIALLSLLGIQKKQIRRIFILEFAFSGILAFVGAFLLTNVIFIGFLKGFGLDLLTNCIGIYFLVDLVVAIVMFILISYILLEKMLRELNMSKMYKDILK